MKIVCMLLFTLSTIFTGITEEKTSINQDNQTVVASYLGVQDNVFFFGTSDTKIAFHKVDESAAKTVDFTEAKLVGQAFKIEFTEEEAQNEAGDSYTHRTILSIEPDSTEE